MATLTPRDVDYADQAPVQIDGSATTDATPAELWAVLIDHPSWPRWFGGGVTRCEGTSDPATGVGSTREVVLGRGRGIRFDERFVAWEDEALWAFTVTEGPGAFRSLVERCTLTPTADGRTHVAYRMAFEPAPALKPLVPVLRWGIGRALGKGMAGLAAEALARRTA